jgi:hypothetical protein
MGEMGIWVNVRRHRFRIDQEGLIELLAQPTVYGLLSRWADGARASV